MTPDQPWLDVVPDWETYYDSKSGYTLRLMDPPSYILDARFEEIGCAFKLDHAPVIWVDGPHVGQYLGDLRAMADAAKRPIRMISHQILFDGAIASWRHGFRADMYVDTLALSRGLLGCVLRRHDLGAVARFLQLGEKGTTVLKVNGLRRADIIGSGLYNEYVEYSKQDAELARGIFDRLFPHLPWDEAVIADMVHRAALEPELEIDAEELAIHLTEIRQEKDQQLAAAGLDVSTPEAKAAAIGTLMSNERMAEVLQGMGVDPPTKISPTTGLSTWAFAKTDDEFTDLLEHPDTAVQTVVAARLGIKSTLEESRTERLINLASLWYPAFGKQGLLPAAYRVAGAHTNRLSGDWRLNLQNLPRPSLRRPKARLRRSVRAPKGKTLVASDSRQIEARATATFCEQWDMVEEFETGQDPYCNMATKVFGYRVDKTMVPQRFCGKLLVLSGNYQTGGSKYRHTLRHNSREQLGPANVILISLQDAAAQINAYRQERDRITGMWKHLQFVVIPAMTRHDTDFMVGCVRVMFEKIVLPNRLALHYHNLRQDPVSHQWLYEFGGRTKKLYGGALLENIIQALARIVVMNAALILIPHMARIGAKLVLQGHDELVYCVPDEHVSYARELLGWAMKLRPPWMTRLPVDCEVGAGANYAEVK